MITPSQQGGAHPCVKVPDPRTFTILHSSAGTRAGEGALGTWARGSHTHSNKANSMQTAAARTLREDGGRCLDLTRERTKSSPLITRKTSGKLRLLHLSTIKRKKKNHGKHIYSGMLSFILGFEKEEGRKWAKNISIIYGMDWCQVSIF